ncbi:MAG: hypothetical protein R2829_00335 [Bacteroidia bacterium]
MKKLSCPKIVYKKLKMDKKSLKNATYFADEEKHKIIRVHFTGLNYLEKIYRNGIMAITEMDGLDTCRK